MTYNKHRMTSQGSGAYAANGHVRSANQASLARGSALQVGLERPLPVAMQYDT